MPIKIPKDVIAIIKLILLWIMVFAAMFLPQQEGGIYELWHSVLFTILISTETGAFVIEFYPKPADFVYTPREYHRWFIKLRLIRDIILCILSTIAFGIQSILLLIPIILLEIIRLIKNSCKKHKKL